jgi:RNA polymerase sigma-70 factor (ECF subfamily)
MTHDPENLRLLVTAAAAGDRGALQKLLLSYYDEIEAAVRPRFSQELAAHMEMEDVIQDILFDVHRRIGAYREVDGVNFGAWLQRLCEHRIIDAVRHLRRRKRGGQNKQIDVHRGPSDESLDAIWDWLCEDENPPDRPARHEEARLAVQVCLAGLQVEQREAVVAHYFEHCDTSEIAERLGRSPGAVRELMRRARENLKRLLGTASAWLSSH